MDDFVSGLHTGPKFGKNGKNMLAQQFMLVVEFIDSDIKYLRRNKNTRVVFEEYLNIINKSVLAFIAPSEDECECYKQDMLDSMSVIKQMAELTQDKLALRILDSRIEELISSMEFYPPHQTIGAYCNKAMAYVNGMRAAI